MPDRTSVPAVLEEKHVFLPKQQTMMVAEAANLPAVSLVVISMKDIDFIRRRTSNHHFFKVHAGFKQGRAVEKNVYFLDTKICWHSGRPVLNT